jgi:hypothetical protein
LSKRLVAAINEQPSYGYLMIWGDTILRIVAIRF